MEYDDTMCLIVNIELKLFERKIIGKISMMCMNMNKGRNQKKIYTNN